MPTVTSATKHFPTAKEGFTTTLASTIISGATTVPLNSVAGFTNGATVVLVIEPTSATLKQAFTGVVDTAGVQITNVVWTEGTNSAHTAGVTVVDYETATHWALYSKGLLVEHNQDGTHSDITAATVTAGEFIVTGSAGANNGWEVGLPTPDTVTYNGNRSYDLVFNSNDLTDTVSNGMRLRATRTVTPPTQCTDLEASSSQYWNKTTPTGITFSPAGTVIAKIKLESYVAGVIASRKQGGGAFAGWEFYVAASGQLSFRAGNTASNLDDVTSYQSVPLGKWVYVAGVITMSTSGSSRICIDGVEVPSLFTNGTSTTITQSGDLAIGANSSGTLNPFDGKLAEVAIFDAALSEATIKTYASQGLTGSETNCVGYWDFNGDGNDASANANNLTAQGGATATTVDSPFNSTEYGIITANSFSTNTTLTVQVPEGYALPTSGGISAVAYSTQATPYGFPSDKGKWAIQTVMNANTYQAAVTSTTVYNPAGMTINFPIGDFTYTAKVQANLTGNTDAAKNIRHGLSTANNALGTGYEALSTVSHYAIVDIIQGTLTCPDLGFSHSAATSYYYVFRGEGSGTLTNMGWSSSVMSVVSLTPSRL